MGRPPKISRDAILAAAAAYQPGDLQLASLAEALGVSVKTIYYYFPSRAALIAALTEAAIAQLGTPDFAAAADWRAVLRIDAAWHYRLGRSHPGWFHDPAPSSARRVGFEALRQIAAALEALGWSGPDAIRAHVVIATWAISQGEAQASYGEIGLDALRAELDHYADGAGAEAVNRLIAPFATPDRLFEDGVEIILAGIERTLVTGA